MIAKFGLKKLEAPSYGTVQSIFDTLNCFGVDHECARQTDPGTHDFVLCI